MSGGDDPRQWDRNYKEPDHWIKFRFDRKEKIMSHRGRMIAPVVREYIDHMNLKRGSIFSATWNGSTHKIKVTSGASLEFKYIEN